MSSRQKFANTANLREGFFLHPFRRLLCLAALSLVENRGVVRCLFCVGTVILIHMFEIGLFRWKSQTSPAQIITFSTQTPHKKEETSQLILPAPPKSFQTQATYSQLSNLTITVVSPATHAESFSSSSYQPAHRIAFGRRKNNLRNRLAITSTHQRLTLQLLSRASSQNSALPKAWSSSSPSCSRRPSYARWNVDSPVTDQRTQLGQPTW